MDVRVIAFNLFACGATIYAFVRGGAPERLGGALLLLAAMLTWLVQASGSFAYGRSETGVLAIDMALLVALVVLALHADRFWPLWIVALHALGTTAHIVKAVDPTILRLAYAILVKVWSYPITAILIVATARHQRRLTTAGRDPDWTNAAAIGVGRAE